MESTIETVETKETIFQKKIEQIMNKEKGLSYSALRAFLQSPKHFFRYKTAPKTTKAMEDGKIFHMSILEPVEFENNYWVLDDTEKVKKIGGAKPRGTNEYKTWLQKQIAQNQGKERISIQDYNLYKEMEKYLRTCSATRDLMSGLSETEKSISFEYNDFLITGKIDGLGNNYILDLKKVANADFNKVRWSIRDNNYDLQAAIYSAYTGIYNYYLIFIDNDINVTVVKLSKETLQTGFNKLDNSLIEFRRCAEEDLFLSSYEFYNRGFVEI